MDSSEIKKKIKKTGFCIFTFFCWYVVIGFFLKSNYPIQEQPFNGVIAYELIRDGLTLSAYFLAPVVAYVLFSGWRVQHIEIKNEKISNDISVILKKFTYFLNRAPKFNSLKDFGEARFEFFINIIEFEGLISQINNSSSTEGYVETAKEMIELLREFELKFTQLIYLQNIIDEEKLAGESDHNSGALKAYYKDLDDIKNEKTEIYNKYRHISTKLTPLKVSNA